MLGDRMRRVVGACTHRDSALAACRDIHVTRAAPGLADMLEARQALDQLAGKARALSNRHDDLSVAQLRRKLADIACRSLEYSDVVPAQQRETVERGDELLIVVGDCDEHAHVL